MIAPVNKLRFIGPLTKAQIDHVERTVPCRLFGHKNLVHKDTAFWCAVCGEKHEYRDYEVAMAIGNAARIIE